MIAIVLAGGLGTRLGALTETCPKPMLPVGSKPFLDYILDYLLDQGATKIILAVSYLSSQVSDYYSDRDQVEFSVEESPMGTGGAIKLAFDNFNLEEAVVVNGDTIFKVPLNKLLSYHHENKALMSMALKPLESCDRYGRVLSNEEGRVVSFEEKGFQGAGNINGGVYVVHKDIFSGLSESKFSFEQDLIAKRLSDLPVAGLGFDDYFLDIGIPEDYKRAQVEYEHW